MRKDDIAMRARAHTHTHTHIFTKIGVSQCRTKALSGMASMWLDLRWVPGCIETVKVHDPSVSQAFEYGFESPAHKAFYVRGADYKLAQLHLGVKIELSEYQASCLECFVC